LKNIFKNLMVISIFVFTFFISGCSSIEFNVEDTIKPPVSENIAVKGTWMIKSFISADLSNSSSGDEENNYKTYIGKKALFDNEVSVVSKDVCINPGYKIIKTNADTFIQNKYRINEDILGLKRQNVSVVTITTDNQLFHELIVPDANTIYIYLDNGFLVLKRISGSVDEKVKADSLGNVGLNIDRGEYKEDPLLRSGVLIGIRSADNTYRTLWLYSKNREIKAKLYRNQLMVPREKGFWEIGATKNIGSLSIYSEPFAEAAPKEEAKIAKVNTIQMNSNARILFAGNDYIGVDNDMKLSVLPIDNLGTDKEVLLSDIIKEDSLNTLKQSKEAFISTLDGVRAKRLNQQADESNFTLQRRNGHWIMKSRLYYKDTTSGKKYEDFDIKQLVPSKLIQYDEMDIPWNEIKSRVPWTKDAYMSPNKDITILVSDDGLSIYSVQNKNTINNQLLNVPLSKGDSIIMTEWAIGKYADIWEKFAESVFVNSSGNGEF
jgi:hypothetical protein